MVLPSIFPIILTIHKFENGICSGTKCLLKKKKGKRHLNKCSKLSLEGVYLAFQLCFVEKWKKKKKKEQSFNTTEEYCGCAAENNCCCKLRTTTAVLCQRDLNLPWDHGMVVIDSPTSTAALQWDQKEWCGGSFSICYTFLGH